MPSRGSECGCAPAFEFLGHGVVAQGLRLPADCPEGGSDELEDGNQVGLLDILS